MSYSLLLSAICLWSALVISVVFRSVSCLSSNRVSMFLILVCRLCLGHSSPLGTFIVIFGVILISFCVVVKFFISCSFPRFCLCLSIFVKYLPCRLNRDSYHFCPCYSLIFRLVSHFCSNICIHATFLIPCPVQSFCSLFVSSCPFYLSLLSFSLSLSFSHSLYFFRAPFLYIIVFCIWPLSCPFYSITVSCVYIRSCPILYVIIFCNLAPFVPFFYATFCFPFPHVCCVFVSLCSCSYITLYGVAIGRSIADCYSLI